MNRKEMIKATAERCGTTDAEARRIIDALQDVIIDTVAKGDEVNWSGLMKIKAKHRSPRKIRNPQTGADMGMSEAKTVPGLTPLKPLKEAVASAPTSG